MSGLDSFTKVLLHFNGTDASTTITESGPLAHTWTANGNAQLDTGITKFGTATLLCDGTGDYVSTPDSSDFTLGSGDWTVDFWFNVAGAGGAIKRAFGQSDSGGTATTQSVYGGITNTDFLSGAANTGGTVNQIFGTTALTTSGWHHYAFVRTGNILKLFLDGVQEGGDLAIAGSVNDSANAFSVGRRGEVTASTWNGSIDEFRLSVGIARWTSNFTPPTAEYDSTVSGTAAIALSQTGVLRGAGVLIGSTSLVFSQTGSAGALVNIAGSASILFAQSGVIAGTGRLIGTTTVTFGQSGALRGAGTLLGSTAITFGQSGVLGAMVPISGTATFTFGQSGTLIGTYHRPHFHILPTVSRAGALMPSVSKAGRNTGSTSKAGYLSPETA